MQFLFQKDAAWWSLALAAAFEITWAISLKKSDGLSRPGIAAFTLVTMILSFVFLAIAVKHLPVGTAYAIWTGAGAVGVAIIGMIWLQEPVSAFRLVSLALVVVGIVGLKLSAQG